jgi:hypothetical protein
VEVQLLETVSGDPSAAKDSAYSDNDFRPAFYSLPVFADDRVNLVTASELLDLGDDRGAGRSRLETGVGDGSGKPGDDVVCPSVSTDAVSTVMLDSQSASDGLDPAMKGPPLL